VENRVTVLQLLFDTIESVAVAVTASTCPSYNWHRRAYRFWSRKVSLAVGSELVYAQCIELLQLEEFGFVSEFEQGLYPGWTSSRGELNNPRESGGLMGRFRCAKIS
jgi:hypothetical protein